MPELPEVETVRNGLAPAMENAQILRVEQRRPDLRFPFPSRFVERLQGRRILRLERRAKFLAAHLDSGEVLIMHLGMSGRFTVSSVEPAKLGAPGVVKIVPGQFVHASNRITAHDHVVFELSSGVSIKFNDPRRFGYMDLVPLAELATCKHLGALGVEPLSAEFRGDYLATKAFGRKTDLKAFLLDQRVVAGLGNIYVCEALHRARLSPKLKAGSLATKAGGPTQRAERLVVAIREVLLNAIAAGGSTLRDYAQVDGALGYFQHSFRVYGREGDPCVADNCGHPIRRIVQSGRSTFYCSSCQR